MAAPAFPPFGQVPLAYRRAQVWDGSPADFWPYGTVMLSVTTAPTQAYTIQSSPDGVNWFPIYGTDLTGAQQTQIGIGYTGTVVYLGNAYFQAVNGSGAVLKIGGAN